MSEQLALTPQQLGKNLAAIGLKEHGKKRAERVEEQSFLASSPSQKIGAASQLIQVSLPAAKPVNPASVKTENTYV
ncbi:hypothetical protein [Pontibacter ummariensis]|uniref:hypothetical protein n=1 Tax=Pontibacter ummariensis TaxID=1610492 RepID=UPI000B76E35E|nr:hypothetical protein [Pontibacter ummariensis]